MFRRRFIGPQPRSTAASNLDLVGQSKLIMRVLRQSFALTLVCFCAYPGVGSGQNGASSPTAIFAGG
jgi:hypothetical protein